MASSDGRDKVSSVAVEYKTVDNEILAKRTSIFGPIGKAYEAKPLVFSGFVLTKHPRNENGTFSEKTGRVVNFVYAPLAALSVKTSIDQSIGATIKYENDPKDATKVLPVSLPKVPNTQAILRYRNDTNDTGTKIDATKPFVPTNPTESLEITFEPLEKTKSAATNNGQTQPRTKSEASTTAQVNDSPMDILAEAEQMAKQLRDQHAGPVNSTSDHAFGVSPSPNTIDTVATDTQRNQNLLDRMRDFMVDPTNTEHERNFAQALLESRLITPVDITQRQDGTYNIDDLSQSSVSLSLATVSSVGERATYVPAFTDEIVFENYTQTAMSGITINRFEISIVDLMREARRGNLDGILINPGMNNFPLLRAYFDDVIARVGGQMGQPTQTTPTPQPQAPTFAPTPAPVAPTAPTEAPAESDTFVNPADEAELIDGFQIVPLIPYPRALEAGLIQFLAKRRRISRAWLVGLADEKRHIEPAVFVETSLSPQKFVEKISPVIAEETDKYLDPGDSLLIGDLSDRIGLAVAKQVDPFYVR